MTLAKEMVNGRKRKREEDATNAKKSRKSTPDGNATTDEAIETEILQLESKILESRKHYNSIAVLLKYMQNEDDSSEMCFLAAVALCRTFCRLIVAGNLKRSRESSGDEATIVQWLRDRLLDYRISLQVWLTTDNIKKKNTALTLLLRVFKEEAKSSTSEDQIWRGGPLKVIIRCLITDAEDNSGAALLKKYIDENDDIRYHTFSEFAELLSQDLHDKQISNVLSVLTAIELPLQKTVSGNFFLNAPRKKKSELYSSNSHKKQAQRAWLGFLQQNLSKAQRKTVLGMMSHSIAPCFLKVELLMDFLTDSFNIGGSISLLALSGLFYLIQNKNLDYPQFYQKLYSLLDADILHSKHRSRFFRLLDSFLASTHLPAALVASFIKRLSRLCLYAPPSGIVVVVPWIYNLLKSHPTCTFMIHRKADLPEGGGNRWRDPFNMSEQDPMETDAIESSLWEIETLQSHYHPNVATIAKIVSEQFTKQSYNLEDFLDHSYATMIDAELSKEIKKAPEVEYEIPKKIVEKYDAESGKEDNILVKLWDFS